MIKMTEKVDDKLLARLKKLEALSSSSNENESEAAMNKLKELMTQYNIENLEELDEDGNVEIEIADDVSIDMGCRTSSWQNFIAGDIAKLFDCDLYVSRVFDGYSVGGKLRRKTFLKIVGTHEDSKMAKIMIKWILNIARRCRSLARPKDNLSYYYGFSYALTDKVDEILKERQAMMASNSNALVVIDEKQHKLKDFMNSLHLGEAKASSVKMGEGFDDGYNDGSKLNLNSDKATQLDSQRLLN